MTPNVNVPIFPLRQTALSSERAFGGGGPAERGEIVREEILYFLGLNTIYFHMLGQEQV